MSGPVAKQRLVALDLGEVSLVDNPANEERFVVTKAKGATTPETSMGVTLDPAVAANVTFQYMQDMMWEAGRKLREGKQAEAMADMERITAMLDQVKQFTAAVTKAATDIATEVTKAKDGDKDKKVPAFMKEALKGAIETLKAAMGDDEETEEAKTEKALEVVLKAGKAQFSKERMAKLHDAFSHMGNIIKEADSDGFAKALEKWAAKPASSATDSGSATQGGGPSGPNAKEPEAATAANGSAVKGDQPVGAPAEAPAWFTKSMETIQKSIDDMKTATQAVTKRVDTIEKVEAVSKALPDNKTDTIVQKSEGTFWKGVI